MPVKVKKITLWRKELENHAGTLSETLEPLAKAGADLQVVMGYCFPGERSRAAVELFPVASKKITAAAQSAGLSSSGIPAVHVEGDNRAGLGHSITRALAYAGGLWPAELLEGPNTIVFHDMRELPALVVEL